MAVNTRIQFRRGSATDWSNSPNELGRGILYQGELGFDTTSGRFKIGNGTSHWNNLPYAGGSDILPGTGISTIFDSANNAYTIHSSIQNSGQGIVLTPISINGNGLTAPSGSGYQIGLSNRLQNVSNLSSSGFIVSTDTTGVTTRSLSSGSNIVITNGDGINDNPIIGLSSSLTGLSSVESNSISGNNVYADNLYVSQNIDITLQAAIIAHGGLVFQASPFIVDGSGIFTSGLYVGPSGSPTGVSLSGHKHSYTDVVDFCSGVASCVDTSLLAGTGIQLIPDDINNTLTVALTGQSLNFNNFTDTGIVIRKSDSTFVGRTISASGSNIWIGNGDGINSNPTVGLNPDVNVTTINTSSDANITGNLTIGGNLVVNGDSIITNVSTVQVEDPIIRLGGTTGTLSNSDFKDRGIEFVYQTGNSVAITGFFGFDHSAKAFTFLTNTTNSNEIYSDGTSGLLNIGGLFSSGGISGTVLTSTISTSDAPIVVSSSGLVTNLNSDLLDGQHGSYYRNWGSLTGLPSPTYTVTLTGDVSGTVTTSATQLGNNVSISVNTTVNGNDSVTLGVETTGQYAKSLSVSGTGLSATTPDADDGTVYTITSNATPSNVTGTIVARDSNGSFSANIITATGFTGDGSNITGIYANNISSGTLNVNRLPTNIPITNLTSSGITIGSDFYALGSTVSDIKGLTSISGTSSASPTNLYYCVIDGGSP